MPFEPVLNCACDRDDPYDLLYRPDPATLADLPPEKHPHWRWIRLLSQEPDACVGYGLAAAINHWLRRQGLRKSVSAKMLFFNARGNDHDPTEVSGVSCCRGALKGWEQEGVCEESQWQGGRPRGARYFPVGGYRRVKREVNEVKAALCERGAIYASSMYHIGWKIGNQLDGVIPANPGSVSQDGHAFAIVGYTKDGFIVQNSWGPEFGRVMLAGRERDGIAVWRYTDFEEKARDLWAVGRVLPWCGRVSKKVPRR